MIRLELLFREASVTFQRQNFSIGEWWKITDFQLSRIQDSSKNTLNTLGSWKFRYKNQKIDSWANIFFIEMDIHKERMSIPDWNLVVDRLAERTTDLETG